MLWQLQASAGRDTSNMRPNFVSDSSIHEFVFNIKSEKFGKRQWADSSKIGWATAQPLLPCSKLNHCCSSTASWVSRELKIATQKMISPLLPPYSEQLNFHGLLLTCILISLWAQRAIPIVPLIVVDLWVKAIWCLLQDMINSWELSGSCPFQLWQKSQGFQNCHDSSKGFCLILPL